MSQQRIIDALQAQFASQHIVFWNDPDGSRYHAAYFARFPNVWCHGDFVELTAHEGLIMPVLIGCRERISALGQQLNLDLLECLWREAESPAHAASIAVEMLSINVRRPRLYGICSTTNC